MQISTRGIKVQSPIRLPWRRQENEERSGHKGALRDVHRLRLQGSQGHDPVFIADLANEKVLSYCGTGEVVKGSRSGF